jgi:glycosyltransferase involved in cell wall biosynthesis
LADNHINGFYTGSRRAIAKTIIDGDNGFIVREGDPVALEEKMKQLLAPEMRKRMGEKSRAFYLELFTEDRMSKKYEECFERILRN